MSSCQHTRLLDDPGSWCQSGGWPESREGCGESDWLPRVPPSWHPEAQPPPQQGLALCLKELGEAPSGRLGLWGEPQRP